MSVVSCAAARTTRSRVIPDRNSCGAANDVMICFFSPHLTGGHGTNVSNRPRTGARSCLLATVPLAAHFTSYRNRSGI